MLEDQLDGNKAILGTQHAVDTGESDEVQIQQYRKFICKSEDLISALAKDMVPLTQGLNKAATQRYRRKEAADVGTSDLYQLARCEDKEFEATLRLLIAAVFPKMGQSNVDEQEQSNGDDDEGDQKHKIEEGGKAKASVSQEVKEAGDEILQPPPYREQRERASEDSEDSVQRSVQRSSYLSAPIVPVAKQNDAVVQKVDQLVPHQDSNSNDNFKEKNPGCCTIM